MEDMKKENVRQKAIKSDDERLCFSENIKPSKLINDIGVRIETLKCVIEKATRNIPDLPDYKLYTAPGKTSNYFRYYLRKDDGSIIYLKKNKTKLKKEYATKKYNLELIKMAKRELCLLDRIYTSLQSDKHVNGDSILNASRKVGPSVTRITDVVIETDDEYIRSWKKEEYKGLNFEEDNLTEYYTVLGERVRSKSEILIANALHSMGLIYKYEKPLYTNSGKSIYPDFTILDVKNRREIYWEHLGLIDDEDYLNHNLWKIDEYKKMGIYVGINLVISYESASRPLGTKEIDQLIKMYILK